MNYNMMILQPEAERVRRRKALLNNLKGYAFIAPNFLLMLVFHAFPVLFSLLLAFTDWDLLSGFSNLQFNGLANFVNMPKDPWFVRSLFNNFYYTLVVVPGTIVLSLLLAVLIHDFAYCKGLFRLVNFIPFISNIVAVSLVWSLLYSKYGPIVGFLKSIGVSDPPAFLANRYWAMPAIIFMSIWMQLGYYALIFGAGLQNIPGEIYEASMIDGANWWQRFFYIILPMLAPTTFFVLISLVIASFKVFSQIQVMTDGGPFGSTSVLVYYIYTSAFKYYKFGYASAMAIVLFVIIFLFTLVQWRGQKKWQLF
ncbi:carbohydrate ABC transporter permease [Capillibacterium thermochitinicola]|nr:sugar ABC transporter permease [Capillibacterium thermochitinicola]